ncbi:hypothetical protein GH714_011524 [Hevea brasiliensis]|uniref:Uncharacterized protein n=1 Tax=Hevea brasiliensis TaxID=3981 RepID=A0A6A6N0I2_HEVBR|nr:hypothetical protein GH714_011524 [Hevea brasiliensis]
MSYLSGLVSLDLSRNYDLILKTSVFNLLVQNLTQLQELDLSGVNMSLVAPSSLMNLSFSLTSLNLHSCSLKGKFPDISHLSELVSLDLSKNYNLLHSLYLHENNLIGQIPSSLGSLKQLDSLHLSYNNFNGEIPSSFENLKQLGDMYLINNNLSGQIPSSLGSLKELYSLDLSYNNFNGEIPSSFENLKQLEEMCLNNNNLNGQIPSSLGSLKELYSLDLSYNNFNGNIQPSLGNLSNLESLDLSSNLLVGRIPMQLTYLTFLEVFRVSHNQLEGPIPEGKQFNTFDNTSYEGNLGLCGFPLEKCDYGERQQPTSSKEIDSKSKNGFGWKAVLAGYGCGVIFGVVMGYVVFKTRKPIWFVRMVEGEGRRKLKRFSN